MDIDIMTDPQRYGYELCPQCLGHGLSLHDPDGACKCCCCGGLGLVQKEGAEKKRYEAPAIISGGLSMVEKDGAAVQARPDKESKGTNSVTF